MPCHHLHAAAAAAAAVCVRRHECRQLSDFDYVIVDREGQLEEGVDKLCPAITYMLLLLPPLLCFCCAGMNATSSPTLTMS